MMIIDSHTHMPSPDWSGHNDFFPSVDAAVQYLQTTGVDVALFNTYQGVFALTEDDLDTANQQALKLAEKFKGFLYPGAVINPLFPEKSIHWLDEFRSSGFMWVGELVAYKCKIEFNQKAWMDLFEYCAKHGHAVQLHNSEGIIDVAAKFPDMQVICSHLNGGASLEKLAQSKNIWLDISGACGGLTIGALEDALKKFGASRILLGSDFTGYEPMAFIARIEATVKKSSDKENIYGRNIIQLLEKIGSRPIY